MRLRRKLALGALVVVATFVCYANAIDGPFLFDDYQLTNEEAVGTRPVLAFTANANILLHGSDPRGFHLFNVVVHACSGLVLFALVRRTLALAGSRMRGPSDTAFAGAVALLWVVHPLQTESVAYICQRAESLAGLFLLACLYSFVRYTARGTGWRWWFVASLVCFALGFGTKEVVAVAPALVLFYDVLFVSGGLRRAWSEHRSFYLLLAGTWGILFSWLVLPYLTAVGRTSGFGIDIEPLAYAKTQAGVVLHYLRLALWPAGLCLDYMWPIVEEPSDYVLQAVAVGGLLAFTAYAFARRWSVAFLGAWFFVILAPTSSFVPIQDPAFEHRMYLPLLSVVVLVVGALARLCRFVRHRWFFPLAVVALASSLGATTVARNRDYGSVVRMWARTVEQRPSNWRAHRNLGKALAADGQLKEALAPLRRSVGLYPLPDTYLDLGAAHARLGQEGKALAAFESADRIRPNYAPTHLKLGSLYLQAGKSGRAIRALRRSLEFMEPDDQAGSGLAHCYLAKALFLQERSEEALEQMQQAVLALQHAVETDDWNREEVHINLAKCLVALGRSSEAIKHHEVALEIAPNQPQEYLELAIALHGVGRSSKALEVLYEARRAHPDAVEIPDAICRLLLVKPSPTTVERMQCLAAAEAAVRLTGYRDPAALEVLAAAFAACGRQRDAVLTLQLVLRLTPPGEVKARRRLSKAIARFERIMARTSGSPLADAGGEPIAEGPLRAPSTAAEQ